MQLVSAKLKQGKKKKKYGGRLLGLFLPHLTKTKFSKPQTEVECIESNDTWQASRLINYLFIGAYFIPCDCYCDVIYDVQILNQKKIQERNSKNLIIVFCVEFYDFW